MIRPNWAAIMRVAAIRTGLVPSLSVSHFGGAARVPLRKKQREYATKEGALVQPGSGRRVLRKVPKA